MKTWLNGISRVVFAAMASAALTALPAFAQSEQQKLVTDAEKTLSNFLRDPEMTWLQNNIGRAKAVLIAPEIAKAGFIIGGSGGRGLLLAHDASGKWAGPAFYTLATASVGFQAGISVSEMITLVMTDKGVNAMLSSSFKFGGDASVAAGPVGAGAKSTITSDLVTFSRSKGLYGGVNLDGTVMSTNDGWNTTYFGKKVLPPDILVRMNVSNPQAEKLLAEIAKATKK